MNNYSCNCTVPFKSFNQYDFFYVLKEVSYTYQFDQNYLFKQNTINTLIL